MTTKTQTTCESDGWIGSLLWGRVGSSILVLFSVILGIWGVEFSQEDQAAAFNIVSAILGSVGATMALVSKIREKRRESDEACLEADLNLRIQPDPGSVPGDITS